MVNDLRSLLSESSELAPYDEFDISTVLRAGRSRTRRRRTGAVGASCLAAGVVVVGSMSALNNSVQGPSDRAAGGVPTPTGTVLHLADAGAATAGSDYRVLTSYTNDNLDRDNGQYLDGLTDDGLVLFRDGPRGGQIDPRYALMDPATGDKDWLPALHIGGQQLWPLTLEEHRLVLLGSDTMGLVAHVFDRDTRQWSNVRWSELPVTAGPWSAELGPDGRLYVRVPATQGKPPAGGWPVQPGGDADDSDARGDTFDLWSVSLTDTTDVRDEALRVGDFDFTEDSMVWTDRTNGDAGMVHVRNLATSEETEFDPKSGEKCNLLSFGAADDRIVLGQYCGTYDGGVRDDRVQVLSSTGKQVATIQDSGIDGSLAGGGEPGLVAVRSYRRGSAGTYVYDLADDRFVRVSDSVSGYALGGLMPAGHLMWDTSTNGRRGATQVVAEWQD